MLLDIRCLTDRSKRWTDNYRYIAKIWYSCASKKYGLKTGMGYLKYIYASQVGQKSELKILMPRYCKYL